MIDDRREAATLSRMFSTTAFHEMSRHGSSPLLARLLKQSTRVSTLPPDTLVRNILDFAFEQLKPIGMRSDYVYRNALIEKRLLGVHSLNTSIALNELRVLNSKADVVIVNGTTMAYEIKSERDTLTRLDSQLNDYKKAFASVSVITSPEKSREVLRSTDPSVGVLVLTQRFTLRTLRHAQSQPEQIQPSALLEILRLPEALRVLREFQIDPPQVPNTRIRSELRRIFQRLDPVELHNATVRILKVTRSQKQFDSTIRGVPHSLYALTFSSYIPNRDQNQLTRALNTPLRTAQKWK